MLAAVDMVIPVPDTLTLAAASPHPPSDRLAMAVTAPEGTGSCPDTVILLFDKIKYQW